MHKILRVVRNLWVADIEPSDMLQHDPEFREAVAKETGEVRGHKNDIGIRFETVNKAG